MSPLWTSKRVKELEAKVAEQQAIITDLQNRLLQKPTETDKMIQALTKLLAGAQAAAALAILLAIGKVVKQAGAGQAPDFKDLAKAVESTLTPELKAKITEDEIAELADSGFRFTKAVLALFN